MNAPQERGPVRALPACRMCASIAGTCDRGCDVRRASRALRLAVLALAVGTAACGSESTGSTPAAPPSITAASPSAELEPELAELPASDLVATLETSYRTNADGSPAEVDPAELPAQPGDVTGHWYRSGDVYVLAYGGLSLEGADPMCPGNSLETAGGFDNVSNSPTADGACPDNVTIAGPGAGLQDCSPLLLYVTAIPVDGEGNLWSTIEQLEDDGGLSGVTGNVPADASKAPEIDLEAGGYTLPDGLVPGVTEVTCSA